MDKSAGIKHKTKLLPMFVFISVGTEALGMLPAIIAGIEIDDILLPSIMFSTLWGLVWATILSVFFVVTIKESGVRGYNFWGTYRLVEWDNIQRCKPINLFGLKYVRVFTDDRKLPVWLPVFVQDVEKFKKDILDKSKSTNCLTTYFLSDDV